MSHTGARLLQGAFHELMTQGQMTVENYFSTEYHQWSDGVELDLQGFREHIGALVHRLRDGWRFDQFCVDEEVGEDNRVVTRHRIMGRKPSGEAFTVHVLALFEVRQGLLFRCWELSHTDSSVSEENLASTRT